MDTNSKTDASLWFEQGVSWSAQSSRLYICWGFFRNEARAECIAAATLVRYLLRHLENLGIMNTRFTKVEPTLNTNVHTLKQLLVTDLSRVCCAVGRFVSHFS